MNRVLEKILMFVSGFYTHSYSFGIKKIKENNLFELSDDSDDTIIFYTIQPKIIFGKEMLLSNCKIQKTLYEKIRNYDHKINLHVYEDSYEYVIYFKNKHTLEEFLLDD